MAAGVGTREGWGTSSYTLTWQLLPAYLTPEEYRYTQRYVQLVLVNQEYCLEQRGAHALVLPLRPVYTLVEWQQYNENALCYSLPVLSAPKYRPMLRYSWQTAGYTRGNIVASHLAGLGSIPVRVSFPSLGFFEGFPQLWDKCWKNLDPMHPRITLVIICTTHYGCQLSWCWHALKPHIK